jgi:hypothetical protein
MADEEGELVVPSEETLTADHGVALLRAIRDEFGKAVVLLDRAPYFYAKKVWALVSGSEETECVPGTGVERVVGEGLRVWYFPPHLPELNPVENGWKRLNAWFNHRFVPGLDALRERLREGLDAIDPPPIRQHICP